VQYRLPTTGELIPLLQIAPSKTDKERLLVVSPELANVLAQIISRVRGPLAAVPLIQAYDDYERVRLPPTARLFQRRINNENQAFAHSSILKMLTAAVTRAGLVDAVDGQPLHYTPHDFRRMFITDAILNGLPPHIAQVIAGHQDINVTSDSPSSGLSRGSDPDTPRIPGPATVAATQRGMPRPHRRGMERVPRPLRTANGSGPAPERSPRPASTSTPCVRCSVLWPDPNQRHRLVDIRDNLLDRIAEAEREGWLGEVEGLRVSLTGAQAKLAQIDQRTQQATPVTLGPTRTKAQQT
jgi:Phage integrase family